MISEGIRDILEWHKRYQQAKAQGNIKRGKAEYLKIWRKGHRKEVNQQNRDRYHRKIDKGD